MINKSVLYKALSTIAILFTGLLAACATGGSTDSAHTLPAGSVRVDQVQQDESLSLVDKDSSLVPVHDQHNALVRWGGTITDVRNLPNRFTLLEIVSRPLRRTGRPVHNDRSSGRFIILVKEFLDPEIIKVGRDITASGALINRLSGKVGQTPYVFPVLQAESYTYWKKLKVRVPHHFPHWTSHLRRNDDPFWFPHLPRQTHR